MIEFDPIKGGSILAIAGPLKHLHFICSDPFFNKDTGAVSVVAVNISSVKAVSYTHLTLPTIA